MRHLTQYEDVENWSEYGALKSSPAISSQPAVPLGVYVTVSPSSGCLGWHVPLLHRSKASTDIWT